MLPDLPASHAKVTIVAPSLITPREAYMKATNKAKFEAMVQDEE